MPLPKNFAILTKPRIEVDKIERKDYELGLLMNFPGAWKAINNKWLEDPDRLQDGGICFLSDQGEFRHFKVWFKYRRRGIAARNYVTEDAEFELWQHKNGFSLAVNAPKALAELAANLLSVAIYKDPFAVRIRKIRKEDFLALVQYTRSIGGKVVVLHLRHIRTEDMGILSVLKISGMDMKRANVDKLLNAAKRVTRIGFYIPNLGGTEFKFWIGHWGGGTIYLPPILEPHHVWTLIRFFEGVLGK